MKLEDKSYNSYNYREVWLITEWKDGFVWKVSSLGHIHLKDSHKYPLDKYELSSISTSKTRGQFMSLEAVDEKGEN